MTCYCAPIHQSRHTTESFFMSEADKRSAQIPEPILLPLVQLLVYRLRPSLTCRLLRGVMLDIRRGRCRGTLGQRLAALLFPRLCVSAADRPPHRLDLYTPGRVEMPCLLGPRATGPYVSDCLLVDAVAVGHFGRALVGSSGLKNRDNLGL